MHRVVLDCDAAVEVLYRTEVDAQGQPVVGARRVSQNGVLTVPSGSTVRFGGYFTAFPEFAWRMHTSLAALALRVRLTGQAWMRVLRWTEATGDVVLWSDEVTGDGDSLRLDIPDSGPNFRMAGRLTFSLTACGDGPLLVHGAEYVSRRTPVTPVGLAIVLCTFDRQHALGAVLGRIASHPSLPRELVRVIVVNQGREGLRDHPSIAAPAARLGETLEIIEQGNFGGAGGFGRGLLAALDDPAATHVCFLDDDVVVEPESLRRMIAFFGVAHPNLCLGGQMLDSLQPCILYEAGALVDPGSWRLTPLRFHVDLREPTALDQLCSVDAIDYNGWWQFGFPLRLAREMGMPLPCFIRGDDVEYGLRLQRHGFATVSLPGVAVWHEPFYLKLGGWQLYYEVRNQLVAAALHLSLGGRHATTLLLKHLLIYLLTFRYLSAALILRGLADFIAGPACLEGDPRRLHASVMALRDRYSAETLPRTTVVPAFQVASSPKSRPMFVVTLAAMLARHLTAPTPKAGGAVRVDARDFVWFRIKHTDAVAVDSYWDRDLMVFRRSRGHARALMAEAVPLLLTLLVRAPRIARAWREAAPRLTGQAFWRNYLDVAPVADQDCRQTLP